MKTQTADLFKESINDLFDVVKLKAKIASGHTIQISLKEAKRRFLNVTRLQKANKESRESFAYRRRRW